MLAKDEVRGVCLVWLSCCGFALVSFGFVFGLDSLGLFACSLLLELKFLGETCWLNVDLESSAGSQVQNCCCSLRWPHIVLDILQRVLVQPHSLKWPGS